LRHTSSNVRHLVARAPRMLIFKLVKILDHLERTEVTEGDNQMEQKPIQKIESQTPPRIEIRKLKWTQKNHVWCSIYNIYTFKENSWSSKNLNWNKHCPHQYRNRSDRSLPEAEDTSLNHGSLTPLPAFHKWPCYDIWHMILGEKDSPRVAPTNPSSVSPHIHPSHSIFVQPGGRLDTSWAVFVETQQKRPLITSDIHVLTLTLAGCKSRILFP